jgi:hypothetical protein
MTGSTAVIDALRALGGTATRAALLEEVAVRRGRRTAAADLALAIMLGAAREEVRKDAVVVITANTPAMTMDFTDEFGGWA